MANQMRPKVTAAECAALAKLFDAHQALLREGWTEPQYFKFPKPGTEFELIELGSTGIHRAVHHTDGEKTCWVDYEWPSNPFLVRAVVNGNT
jgi:hypothetical protein